MGALFVPKMPAKMPMWVNFCPSFPSNEAHKPSFLRAGEDATALHQSKMDSVTWAMKRVGGTNRMERKRTRECAIQEFLDPSTTASGLLSLATTGKRVENSPYERGSKKPFWEGDPFLRKPGDHPDLRKNALRVKRPFSELSESSAVFSEQLSEFEIPSSEYEIPFSEWHPTT